MEHFPHNSFRSRAPLDFKCFDKYHLNMFGSELRKFGVLNAVPLLAGHSISFQFVQISSVGTFGTDLLRTFLFCGR